jgi:hypothetical protein
MISRLQHFTWIVCLLMTGLAACTTDKKLREAELGSIEHWLPGVYDNRLEIDEARAKGVAAPESVDLVIVRVSSMMIGKTVFYEQQFDSRDPRRILRQRLHRFEPSEDGAQILHSMLSLREPGRWIMGYRRPEIFKSLMPEDVSPGNCQLHWKLEKGTFVATNGGPCRASTEYGRPALLETRIELNETELKVSERLVSSSGEPLEGTPTEPIRYVKKGG